MICPGSLSWQVREWTPFSPQTTEGAPGAQLKYSGTLTRTPDGQIPSQLDLFRDPGREDTAPEEGYLQRLGSLGLSRRQ